MKTLLDTEVLLFHGDCVRGMRKHVPNHSVDIVVTSPPYNLGVKYSSYQDRKSWAEYHEWTLTWAREVRRCLTLDASFFLVVGGSPSTPLLPFSILNSLVEEHSLFHLQNTVHWVKSIAVPDARGVEKQRGHYKPITSKRYVNDCHEYVFHLTPRGQTELDRKAVGVPYADKSNIARWGHTQGEDLKCRGNVWWIPYKTITRRAKDRPHPATFPDALVERCIKLHGKNGASVVMDPFLGIGHTAYAAIDCRVKRVFCFEIDREYLRVVEDELRNRSAAFVLKSV